MEPDHTPKIISARAAVEQSIERTLLRIITQSYWAPPEASVGPETAARVIVEALVRDGLLILPEQESAHLQGC